MSKKITVICDDDVDVISITTRSKKIEGDSWVIGIFDVADNTEVCMPNIFLFLSVPVNIPDTDPFGQFRSEEHIRGFP